MEPPRFRNINIVALIITCCALLIGHGRQSAINGTPCKSTSTQLVLTPPVLETSYDQRIGQSGSLQQQFTQNSADCDDSDITYTHTVTLSGNIVAPAWLVFSTPGNEAFKFDYTSSSVAGNAGTYTITVQASMTHSDQGTITANVQFELKLYTCSTYPINTVTWRTINNMQLDMFQEL